jgi:thiosulfate reductase cytochrome b subunit
VAVAGAALWAAALAAADGVAGFLIGPSSRLGYLHDVPLVGSPGAFLSGFVDRIGMYSAHVRAHPPGMVLLLWSLDRLGLSGPGWVAALEILGGAAAVPAASIAVREVAGEAAARRAVPFLVLAPAAVTLAASGDALFTGVAAWAIALVVLATGRTGRTSDGLAWVGGVLFGATLFLSYGLVLLSLLPLAVAIGRRRFRPLAAAAVGIAAVVGAFGAAGFWWGAGLLAARREYLASVARFRPYGYFLVADLAAFAVILGPAAIAGLVRLRHRATWLLVGGALVAVALADVSGMSKGEVERIWLPFAPWVLLAAAALPERTGRAWLAATAVAALALQLLVVSPW